MPKYLFIDECGDPNFYGQRKKLLVGEPGYQPLLLMGALTTSNRQQLRAAVSQFQQAILADPLYNTIPSVAKPGWYLHAKNDHPEVRAKFFELLRQLPDFTVHIVIGRKKLAVFNRKHNNSPTEFYFDLLHHLLQYCLHEEEQEYALYLAQRGKNNSDRFQAAVAKALPPVGSAGGPLVRQQAIVLSSEYPELSVVDYCLWALQRYIFKEEARFFKALESRYAVIVDLYDDTPSAAGGQVYRPQQPFTTQQASPFDKPV
ncbi:MAG: hypothetical protein ACRYFX_08220 [Janthinobacterium lividum]